MSDRVQEIARALWDQLCREPDPRTERTVNAIAAALRAYAEEVVTGLVEWAKDRCEHCQSAIQDAIRARGEGMSDSKKQVTRDAEALVAQARANWFYWAQRCRSPVFDPAVEFEWLLRDLRAAGGLPNA